MASAKAGKKKELAVIIKGDVHGSVEAIAGSLKKIEDENLHLAELQKDQKMLKEEVDEEDVAEVVSRSPGRIGAAAASAKHHTLPTSATGTASS